MLNHSLTQPLKLPLHTYIIVLPLPNCPRVRNDSTRLLQIGSCTLSHRLQASLDDLNHLQLVSEMFNDGQRGRTEETETPKQAASANAVSSHLCGISASLGSPTDTECPSRGNDVDGIAFFDKRKCPSSALSSSLLCRCDYPSVLRQASILNTIHHLHHPHPTTTAR